MLNNKLKLNPKVFDKKEPKKSTRQGYGNGLVKAALSNENIIGLCADLTESTKMSLFAEKFPDRFIELGVAEQNLASVASGLAATGKIPFISSFAIFSPGRNWEQIRTTICYNNVPVKIASTHSGLSVGADGGSHQALEDIALTRVLPNIDVIYPCDAIEAEKATIAISKTNRPTYLRLTREKFPIITTEETIFEIGKAQIVFIPEKGIAKVGIIASGPILYNVLEAAKKLAQKDIYVKVVNLSTIKPIDKEAIINLAKETKAIITIEDHQRSGGMGSAVTECLSENYPVLVERMGVDDDFGQSGTTEELYKYYKLDQESIVSKVKEIINKKTTF